MTFTTDPVDLNYENTTSEDAKRPSSSVLNSTPVPSFTELVRASSVQLSSVSTKSMKSTAEYAIQNSSLQQI